MKYFVILSLVVFCAYEFSSIKAASTSRHKRWLLRGDCPENMKTSEECLSYLRETGKANRCVGLSSDGEGYTIAGCGTVQCVFNGKEVEPVGDMSKPYPQCCPTCSRA